jgi:hypothetical protein
MKFCKPCLFIAHARKYIPGVDHGKGVVLGVNVGLLNIRLQSTDFTISSAAARHEVNHWTALPGFSVQLGAELDREPERCGGSSGLGHDHRGPFRTQVIRRSVVDVAMRFSLYKDGQPARRGLAWMRGIPDSCW